MTQPSTDRQLLWEYVAQRSQLAFETLVKRHANLVFATGLRRLGNQGAAEEVTQNVFIALARKAGRLHAEVNLAGWLHKTAVLEARRWWRDELRRLEREKTAMKLGTTMQDNTSHVAPLAPALDEGLLELREVDRQALILRYFENHSHREVGMLLGIGEDAARKRIDKALDQLTRFFRRRGHSVPTVAATATILVSCVRPAPASLAISVSKAALASSGSSWVAPLGFLLALIWRFLGLGKMQVVGTALLICAVPVAQQAYRTNREVGQKQKLEARVLLRAEEKSRLEGSVRRLEGRVRSAESVLAGFQKAAVRGEAANIYVWEEDSDYVRLPKSLVPRLTFSQPGAKLRTDERNELLHVFGAGAVEFETPVIAKDGTPSTSLLDALGLTVEESREVANLCRSVVAEYFSLELPRCYVTNTGEDFSTWGGYPAVQSFMKTNRESRTWVMPRLGGEGEVLRHHFNENLAQLMDKERIAVFFEQSSNAFRVNCNDFGAVQRKVTVDRTGPETTGAIVDCRPPRGKGDGWIIRWDGELPEALQPFAHDWHRSVKDTGQLLQQ